MERKKNDAVRSIADEPIMVAEVKPAATDKGVKIVKKDGTVASLHPSRDPGPDRATLATQTAREINPPTDQPGVPYSGVVLALSPYIEPAQSTFTGEALMTTAEEAAQRMPPAGGDA